MGFFSSLFKGKNTENISELQKIKNEFGPESGKLLEHWKLIFSLKESSRLMGGAPMIESAVKPVWQMIEQRDGISTVNKLNKLISMVDEKKLASEVGLDNEIREMVSRANKDD